MLPYYGTLPHLSKLMDSIEKEGRSTCALLAPYHNLEMPGGALSFVVNNHTQPITAAIMQCDIGIVSVSDKLVYFSMESGEIVTDTRPRSMPENDHFVHLAIVQDGYVLASISINCILLHSQVTVKTK